MEPFDAQPTPPRRGRRDNGLGADRYVPLLDVDPRIGEHLLDVLRMAGVPAYLEPAMDVEPYTRAASIPSPPTDRLWVDRERRDTARDIITAETSNPVVTGPPPLSGSSRDSSGRDEGPSRGLTDEAEEQAWREIISRYDRDFPADPARGGVPPWPVSEDLDQRPAPVEPVAARPVPEAEPEPAPDPEEHYVPPAPGPLPKLSKQSILALILLAVGALLLLWPQLLGFSEDAGLALGVVSLVSAGGLLVLRLREDRYDDPDDGAVL
jgi:hypothetical protein